MNKKTILNRTLPLIIALGVILVVAICVTVFSGEKKTPQISTASDSYLTVNMEEYGYDTSIEITNKDIYERLKNGDSGLTYLVDMLDASLLTKEGYLNKYVDVESLSAENEKKLKEAVKEAILGADYEVEDFDDEEQDAIEASIKKWETTLKYSYAIDAKGKVTADAEEGVKVTLSPELQKYYGLILARKEYTRDQLGEDQVESYKEFIDAYEEYLTELHKFNEEKISTSPVVPTDTSTITSSSVKADWEKENTDAFWAIYVTYATQAEAEKALLQAGVVIFSSNWYEYEGIIDLDDYKEEGKRKYASESAYYSKEGTKLGRYEILNKLVELYNNANPKAQLEEGIHYNLKQINADAYKALEGNKINYDTAFDASLDSKNYDAYNINATEYEALSEAEKALYGLTEITETAYKALSEKEQAAYTKVDDKYTTYTTYKAIIFTLQEIPNDEKELENKEFALYHTSEELTKANSSIKSWISSLSAAYADGGKWASSYSKSIQAKGSQYVVGAKFYVVEAETFAEKYGDMYDTDQFEEDGTYGKDYLGYVPYTVNDKGEKEFDFEDDYWKHVLELLDDSVTSANINKYMAELRNENKLVIYDAKLESAYTTAYTSDYKNTKKSSNDVVAKLSGKNEDGSAYSFTVKADDLFNELFNAFGAEIAMDAYQFEKVLYQNEIIDYAKYKAGYDMDDCVIITDYALAKKGTLDPVTSWVEAEIDGTVTFKKVDGSQEYDVLVRKGTTKKDKNVEVFELNNPEDLEVEDTTSKKTTVTVTLAVEENYRDSQDIYEFYDEQIEAMKLSFTNGYYTEQGYDPSYGWKNFLRDYFAEFFGITVKNNNDLRLYFIYQDTVEEVSADYALIESELLGDDKWSYYLPLMQKEFDKFFSVDGIHFLISVNDEEGQISDPEAKDTAWTAEQKAAAEELYGLVAKILAKTKKASQGTVLQEIVDEFDAAPKFIPGKGETTAEQQAYIDSLYAKYLGSEVFDTPIEYTTTVRGIELELSKYKTLGLNVKYEDLSTITADQMVEKFEDAVKELWLERSKDDSAMAEGSALEDNVIYGYENGSMNPEKVLVTEFGYHVLVANKFTGKTAYEYDTDSESEDYKNKVTLSLRELTSEIIKLYEANDKTTEELSEYQIQQLKTYYEKVLADFQSSYWYQLNVMKGIKADIEAGLLNFKDEATKARAIEAADYYIEVYYDSMTYVSVGFDWAMDLMETVVDGFEANLSEYADEVANLKAIAALANAELAKLEISAEGEISGEYSRAEKAEFAELYAEFVKVCALLNAM